MLEDAAPRSRVPWLVGGLALLALAVAALLLLGGGDEEPVVAERDAKPRTTTVTQTTTEATPEPAPAENPAGKTPPGRAPGGVPRVAVAQIESADRPTVPRRSKWQ